MNPSVTDLRDEVFSKLEEVFEKSKGPEPETEPPVDLTQEQIEILKAFHKNS